MSVAAALEERVDRGEELLYGIFGAGFMAKGILNQNRYARGLRCAAVCNRTPEKAMALIAELEIGEAVIVTSVTELDAAIETGAIAITDDPGLLCESSLLESLVEATGNVEYGARVTLQAIEGRKHIILMNAELDATVGPLLASKANEAGLVYTGCDGDQPVVEMDLYRFVQTLQLEPLVCGNIKGLQDRYRNPTTQESFARQWGQTPSMVTSFADGTKISFEQAIVANATGMGVERRGMRGIEHTGHVDDLTEFYDVDELRRLGGVVDYVIGASPSPGVYVLAAARDDVQAHYLSYGKLGDGPLYSFYVPYHLTVLEVPRSVVRAVDLKEAAIAPLGGPVVDVIATAKRDLQEGETIDGLGGYMTYGMCENHATVAGEGLLPMGLAEGSILKRDVSRDEVIRIEDVQYPTGTVVHALRSEQDSLFRAATVAM